VKPEGKMPFGRPRLRWEYNIRMNLKEIKCVVTDWIKLAHDRDRWSALVKCSNEPSGSIKCGEFLD